MAVNTAETCLRQKVSFPSSLLPLWTNNKILDNKLQTTDNNCFKTINNLFVSKNSSIYKITDRRPLDINNLITKDAFPIYNLLSLKL